MFDPEKDIRRALDVCETKQEAMVLMCGLLLGMRAKLAGEPFAPGDPNGWPRRLVEEMLRVAAIASLAGIAIAPAAVREGHSGRIAGAQYRNTEGHQTAGLA